LTIAEKPVESSAPAVGLFEPVLPPQDAAQHNGGHGGEVAYAFHRDPRSGSHGFGCDLGI